MRISHSAVEKYKRCSMEYKHSEIDRWRPIIVSSTLIWGGAIDEGLNELLRTKLDKPEIMPTPFKAFQTKWDRTEINGEMTDLKFSTLIEYSKKDLDLALFTTEDYLQIKDEYPDEDPELFALQIESERLKFPWWSYAKMEENSKIAYNFLCWLSLARKARYIFEAYDRDVMPRIKHVISIQEEIRLENDTQDFVKGFIDFICEWEDGSIYICDNKTTSDFKYYKEDCVKSSNQLSLYGFAKDLPKGMYIAILKDIKADGRKKGSLPTVKIKIRQDDLDLSHQDQTITKFNETVKKIKDKVFVKLADPEMCIFYGKKCPYAGLCWGGSTEGLFKKEVTK